MISDPNEIRENLQEAFKEVAEFVVPMKSQRFRKRDRFYFHGRRFVRSVQTNMGTLARASMDPTVRRRALERLTRNFLR